MGTIINIIIFCLRSGQLNLHCLNGSVLSCRTGYLSACGVSLPSFIFHKGRIAYTQISITASDAELKCLKPPGLARHADLHSVLY